MAVTAMSIAAIVLMPEYPVALMTCRSSALPPAPASDIVASEKP
jgi:hypothetical protein